MFTQKDSQMEFEWIMRHRLPDILSRIHSYLTTSIACTNSQRQTLAITAPNNDMVKGVVTIDGCSLVKGELNIKLPHYNRGQPLKVALNPTTTYPLSQLSSFRDCMHLALTQVEAIQQIIIIPERKSGEEGAAAEQELSEEYDEGEVESTWIYNQFNALSKVVHDAVKMLSSVDEEKLFPIRENDGKFFAPELSNDLVIEFYMANPSSLAVSIYAIAYHQHAIPLQIQSQILSRFKQMKIETYKGNPIEILDEVYLECKIPNLSHLENDLQGALGLCESVVDLLEALR
ncbi:RAVE subunit 2/Rogdi [Obelidium mucronatum]|nr:RAVE subunit 2/Rogdi [Obelidium mucronatum]